MLMMVFFITHSVRILFKNINIYSTKVKLLFPE